MRTMTVRVDDGAGYRVGVAGSTTVAHWVDPEPGQRDHGGGRTGASRPAGDLTVFSLVRGAWEVRLARVDNLVDGAGPTTLRVSGWPVAGDGTSAVSPGMATATGSGLTSLLTDLGLAPYAPDSGVAVHEDAGPLGHPVRVPYLDHPVRPGTWVATLIELSGGGPASPDRLACRARLVATDDGLRVRVDWPDGVHTHSQLSTHIMKEKG
jgi:hypothetical protein